MPIILYRYASLTLPSSYRGILYISARYPEAAIRSRVVYGFNDEFKLYRATNIPIVGFLLIVLIGFAVSQAEMVDLLRRYMHV